MPPNVANFGINVSDTICVVSIAVTMAVVSEVLTYLVFFRSAKFRQQQEELVSLTRKLARVTLQEPLPARASAKPTKAVSCVKKELANKNQAIGYTRQKANLLAGVMFAVFMPWMYTTYEGVVIAKLPIEPMVPFRYLTHATLPGDDYTDCSFTFIVTTTMLVVKTAISKYLGYAAIGGAPSGSGPFGLMPPGSNFGSGS